MDKSARVDDHLGVAAADALEHFAEQRRVTAGRPADRVTHVQVDDGRAGGVGIERRSGDLLGCYRDVRTLTCRIA